jgi:hypothetical protein
MKIAALGCFLTGRGLRGAERSLNGSLALCVKPDSDGGTKGSWGLNDDAVGSGAMGFDRGFVLQANGREFVGGRDGLSVTGVRGIALTITRVPTLLDDEAVEVDEEGGDFVIFAMGGSGRRRALTGGTGVRAP